MSREFWERTRKFSIRKLTVGAASILIGISPITSSVLQVITYADTIGEPQKASYIVNTTNTLQNLAIQIANPTPSYDTVSSHLATISDLISEYESERVNKSDYEAGSFENYENVANEAKIQYDNLKSIYDAMVALRDSGKVQQYADTAVSIRSAHMTSDGRSEWALDGDIGEVGPTVAERTAAYEQILNMFTEVYPTIKAYADTVSTTTLQSIESKLNSAKGNLAPSAAKQVRDQGLLSEKLVTPVKVSNLNGTLTPDDKKNIRLALEDLEVFYSGWASTSKLIFNDNGTMTIVFDDDGSTATVNLSDFNIIQDPAVSPAPDPGEKKYTVSYSYVGAPSSEVPPAAVQLKSGEAIEFPEEGKEVSDRTTIYSLSWDKTITVVSDRDVNIVGTWTSTARPTYTIRYKYEGSVPSGETAPSSVTGLYTGDAVTVPTNRTVQRPEGTYHLTWSTPTSSTVSDQDVEVVGTWSFTPVTAKTYKVTATYKTMDGKDLAPADVQNIEDTKSYTTSAQNELTVKGITYTLKTAPANATGTVSGSDVTVNYVYEVKDLAVNYAFNTTSGFVLPGIVTSLLPTSSTAKSGSVVTATPSSFSSQSDRVSGKPGQWVFIGWDAATKVVENTSLLFTGLWTFQEDASYKVTYRYAGDIPNGETAPATVSNLYAGDQIPVPESKTVETRESVYRLTWSTPTSSTIVDQDVEVVGTWTSTAKPTYTIRYKYEGSVPSGETAPSSVTGLYTGDAVTVPTNRTVQHPEGTYHLTWSTPTSSTVSDQDVEVVGTWSFTPVTAKTYKVTATYKTMDGKDLAPADVQNIEDTKSYETSAQNELTVKGVTYTLKTAPANATGTVSGSDVTVNYVYEVKDLAVNYAFNTTSGLVLPGIVTSLLPTSSTAKSGSVVTATPSSFSSQSDRVSGKPGQWVFIGWDAATKVVENTSLLFTGLWTFQEDASYKVTYRYAGDIPNGETAPATVSNLYAGDQIPVPESKTVETRESVYRLTWSTPTSSTIVDQDVEVVGTWTSTAKPTYTIRYKYEGSVPSGETAPSSVTGLYTGDAVTVPTNRTVQRPEGTYHLTWSTPTSSTVSDQDVEVVGTWSFTPVTAKTYKVTATYKTMDGKDLATADVQNIEDTKSYETSAQNELTVKGVTYTLKTAPANATGTVSGSDVTVNYVYEVKDLAVNYEFNTTSGLVLPGIVTSLLPTSSTAKSGSVVTATPSSFSSQSDRVSGKPGQWVFIGWDAATKVVENTSLLFTGLWTFQEDASYKVTYRYAGDIPNGETAPATVSNLYAGDQIPVPKSKTVETRESVYRLTWSTPTSSTIVDQDVEVVGTWTSTAKPTYTIHYKYEGSVPSGETAPSSVTGLYTGDAVTVPTNRTVQRPEGTYHLTWSTPTSSTVSDQDVEVVGTWSFEAGHIAADNNTTSSNDMVSSGRKVTRNVVVDKNDVKSGNKEVLPNTSSQNSNFLPIIGISILWASAGLWYKKGRREDEL